MKDGKKLAFLLMSADIIHPGHLNIIHEALKLNATIMVGLYSDEAIASYKRVPFMNFEQRKTVLENIKGVDIVIEQKTRNVRETLLKYKPDYFVHGTDWRNGALAKERQNIIDTISQWGGQLVEPEYTAGICSSNAHAVLKERGTTPEQRQQKLFKSVEVKKKLRACSVYDCLSASIAEKSVVKDVGKPIAEFDAMWIDSRQLAEVKGKSSTNLLDFSEIHILLNDISDISVKPFIFNYGRIFVGEQFISAVHCLEKVGVSAVAVEKGEEVSFKTLGEQLAQAKLSLMNNNMQFAAVLNADEVSEALITAYENVGISAFVLEGDQHKIAEMAEKIKQHSSTVIIMAAVEPTSDKQELALYDHCVSVLVYKDSVIQTVRQAIEDRCLQILG